MTNDLTRKNNVGKSRPAVYIVNKSRIVSDTQIEALIPGLQDQLDQDFGPVWGLSAKLIFGPPPDIRPNYSIEIREVSDEPGDLGYHVIQGFPTAYVFRKDAMADGAGIDGLSATLSHELLEMIVDPGANLYAVLPQTKLAPKVYSYEVCDPVESSSYKKGKVTVANFVFPEWFEPERPAGTQLDFLKTVDGPFKLGPKGYVDLLVGDRLESVWSKKAERKPVEKRHRFRAREARLHSAK